LWVTGGLLQDVFSVVNPSGGSQRQFSKGSYKIYIQTWFPFVLVCFPCWLKQRVGTELINYLIYRSMNVTEHVADLTKLSEASEDVGTWSTKKLSEWFGNHGAKKTGTKNRLMILLYFPWIVSQFFINNVWMNNNDVNNYCFINVKKVCQNDEEYMWWWHPNILTELTKWFIFWKYRPKEMKRNWSTLSSEDDKHDPTHVNFCQCHLSQLVTANDGQPKSLRMIKSISYLVSMSF